MEQVTPFASLAEYFDLAEAADADNEYAVAWIDQLAGGPEAGRGLLLTGNHAALRRTRRAGRAGSAFGAVPAAVQPCSTGRS